MCSWTDYYGLILMVLLGATMYGQSSSHIRQKRYLIFTKSTQWGVFATVSVPLSLEGTVSVAWFFEANYYNVDNTTYFDPLLGDIETVSQSRKDRSVTNSRQPLSRSRLYSLIGSMLDRNGYRGTPCLLRAICENAHSHFLHNGLLGDWLHLILTPSTSMSEDEISDSYYEAEYYGMENECQKYLKKCPSNPLDSISMYADKYI